MIIKIQINDKVVKVIKKIFSKHNILIALAVVLAGTVMFLFADDFTQPYIFKPGSIISSYEMNKNFDEMVEKINQMDSVMDNLSTGGDYWDYTAGPTSTLTFEGGNVGIGTDDPDTAKLAVIGGKVGVGLTNPSASVDIDTINNFDFHLALRNTDNGGQNWFIGSSGTGWGCGGTGKLVFTTTGSANSQMVIQENGNVGIGTTSPGQKLEVQTGTNQYGIVHTDGTIELATYIGGTLDGAYIGTMSNHGLYFFTNSSGSNLTVTETGNIGIGNNTSPNYLLEMETSGGGYYSASDHQWHNGSTRDIKTEIKPNSMDVLEILKQIEIVNYRYKTEMTEDENAPDHIGFIAEDTPPLLSGKNQDSMAIGDCIGILLAVVKEQQEMIVELQKQVKTLME